MIFVDSNIPMYLVGAPHPHREDSRRLLEEYVLRGDRLVTDVEVFQEILHRYVHLRRWADIPPAWDALAGTVDEVFPIEFPEVERARDIALGHNDLSARDSLHLAVMESHGVNRILSFDTGFDSYPGITRLY